MTTKTSKTSIQKTSKKPTAKGQTLAAYCTSKKMDAKVARRRLRVAGMKKPAGGWMATPAVVRALAG